MTVRAVVFDFDGLILDTETPLVRGWAGVFGGHGCPPLTPAEWGTAIGTATTLDPVAILVDRAVRAGLVVDAEAARRAGHHAVRELIAAEVARPGVEAWLDEADGLGLASAIASSSPAAWVEGHLDRLGLRRRFQVLACHRPGVAAKPAPDLYLEACARLGVHPGQALAVEDSPHGIAAAKAAGLRCVAVPNDLTGQLDLGGADLVVERLAEVGLAQVLERL
ncbi:MAG TPA: HAD-IA family hydrolase [Actinomycetes bacterium]|nr:HAD-IA family hydrolase [Actinomycetes bacterium]